MPRLALAAVPVLAVAGGALALLPRPADPVPAVEVWQPDVTAAPTPGFVIVDVAGAVSRPGVVRLPAGSRVLDALLAAGGMTPDADPFAINKAAVLRDGTRIYVPRPGEPIPVDAAGLTGADGMVDINRAAQKDLESLPGVGPATALRIIRSRESSPFTRVEELQTRGLVSARVFAAIRDLVTTR